MMAEEYRGRQTAVIVEVAAGVFEAGKTGDIYSGGYYQLYGGGRAYYQPVRQGRLAGHPFLYVTTDEHLEPAAFDQQIQSALERICREPMTLETVQRILEQNQHYRVSSGRADEYKVVEAMIEQARANFERDWPKTEKEIMKRRRKLFVQG